MRGAANTSIFDTATLRLHSRELGEDGLVLDFILLCQRSANTNPTLYHRRIDGCYLIRHGNVVIFRRCHHLIILAHLVWLSSESKVIVKVE